MDTGDVKNDLENLLSMDTGDVRNDTYKKERERERERKKKCGSCVHSTLWLTNLQLLKSSNKDHATFFKD